MKAFWGTYGFWIIFSSTVILAVLILTAQRINLSPAKTVADNITQPQITLAHIDKDGTVWVEINGNLYYLYISDNGTQKKLEVK